MSSTGVAWLVAYGIGCLAALVNPIYGLLAYLFTYYTNPPLHWWGEGLPAVRWSLTIALLTALSYAFRRAESGSLPFFSHPQTKWLAGLLLISACVTPFAVSPPISSEYTTKLAKVLVLYFLFAKVVTTWKSYRWVILVHVLGGFYWGLEAFLDPETESGRLVNVGGPDSNTSNMTAAHILTILPFVGYYVLAVRGYERWICLGVAPFILRALVMLNSRGSMIGLVGAGLFAVVLGWRVHRGRTLLGLAAGVAAILTLGGTNFLNRQATMLTYEEDYSAVSRLEMWQAAVEMIRDHPLGVGGQGYDLLSPKYLPDMVEKRDVEQTVHNTYLMTGAEWGIPGLICFLGFLASVFWQLHRLRATPPTTDFQRRIHLESMAVEVAMVGLLVAGFFINRLYGESLYWLGGLSAALANLSALERTSPSRSSAGRGTGTVQPSPAVAGG